MSDARQAVFEEAMRRSMGLAGIFGDVTPMVLAVMRVADAELASRAQSARELMGPKTMPHESEGPRQFAAGWYAALEYMERES